MVLIYLHRPTAIEVLEFLLLNDWTGPCADWHLAQGTRSSRVAAARPDTYLLYGGILRRNYIRLSEPAGQYALITGIVPKLQYIIVHTRRDSTVYRMALMRSVTAMRYALWAHCLRTAGANSRITYTDSCTVRRQLA